MIKSFQKGSEEDQARIGIGVSQNWIWPYAYQMEGLLKMQLQPDFDPEMWLYCFHDGKMVGYMFSVVSPLADGSSLCANLNFPRMLPGHEQAAELLMERTLSTLKQKGVTCIKARVTTMCPAEIPLAEKFGFSIKDWGYKVYYSYEISKGKLFYCGEPALDIATNDDLIECANLASIWYKQPPEWCFSHLRQWHTEGIIAHVGVRRDGKLIASCMCARNEIRPTTAALYYIYAPDEESLCPMLVKIVNTCGDKGVVNVIADLINEHRGFESVYQKLGFNKVAEWARCEKEFI